MVTKGMLIECKDKGEKAMFFRFDFNPEKITFSRSVNATRKNTSGKSKAKDRLDLVDDDITFSLKFLLDSTGNMEKVKLTPEALGIQPQIDVIERMASLQSTLCKGSSTLKKLSGGGKGTVIDHQDLPVLLFLWGPRVLPCRMTKCSVENEAFLSSLIPYRARVDLSMTIVRHHPLFDIDAERQLESANLCQLDQVVNAAGSFFI